ncbi:MAG: hypothetical protein Q4D02_07410 [Clostridia bacterium]|nr:hypothetical protein [Clostridia bacterium]
MKGAYEFDYFELPVKENYLKIKKARKKIAYRDIFFARNDHDKAMRIRRTIARDMLKKQILKKEIPIYVLVLLDHSIEKMYVTVSNIFTREEKEVLFVSKRAILVSMNASDRVDIEFPLEYNRVEIRSLYYKDFLNRKSW